MRNTKDLVEELKEEARNFTNTALALGFENTTTFVFADDKDALSKLNEAVQVGGEPIGILGWDFSRGLGSLHVRPLREYASEDWAVSYLHALAENFKGELIKRGAEPLDL